MKLGASLLSEVPGWRRVSDLSVRRGGEHGLKEKLSWAEKVLRTLDFLSTAVFAVEGVLAAGFEIEHRMDLLGCVVVGTVTAVGGGTLRDLVLTAGAANGAPRPFWIDEPQYIWTCVITCIATFTCPPLFQDYVFSSKSSWLITADAVAMGVFAVIGTINGVAANIDPGLCVLSGMMTATFGGVVRDILCQQPIRILHSDQELYAECAMIGSAVYMMSRRAGFSSAWRMVFGITATCLSRWASVVLDLRLPVHSDLYIPGAALH